MSLWYRTSWFVLVIALGACSAPGTTKVDKRQHIESMHSQVLKTLYKVKPDSRKEIRNAPGYAVFSNVNINLLFASVGNGFGVVKNQANGSQTYMKMGEVGFGLGLGVKDFRAVFIFQSREVMDRFVNSGWSFGGQADAAAKAESKGAAIGGEIVLDGIKVYQLTESGLALQATVKGTKYWQDSELN